MSRNSTDRIAEGLSRLRETADTPPAAQLDPKTGRTKPRKDGPDPLPEGLVELARAGNFANHAERAAAAVRRLEIFAEKLDETLAGTREQTEQTLRNAGLKGQQLRSAVTKAVKSKRRELIDASDAMRRADLQELQQLNELVSTHRALYETPQAMLFPFGIGEARRMHIEQTLANAGHATIRNMAARAIADRDEAAGAAILAVLDKMPAEGRPVSTEELESRVLGDRHTSVTQSMAMVANRLQDGILIERAIASDK